MILKETYIIQNKDNKHKIKGIMACMHLHLVAKGQT